MKLLRKLPEERILRVQAKTFVDQRVLEHMEIERCRNTSRRQTERQRKALQDSKAKQIDREKAFGFLMANQLQERKKEKKKQSPNNLQIRCFVVCIQNTTPKVTLGLHSRKTVQTGTTLKDTETD